MKYLIKSLKWTTRNVLPVWWRPRSNGYTDNPENAGLYELKETEIICKGTHGDDIAILEKEIDLESYRRSKRIILRGALENTTYSQTRELMNEILEERLQTSDDNNGLTKKFPKVICLCGSTRFFKEFQEINYQETMKGNIILSVGFYPHFTEQAHGQNIGITDEQKIMLDELHKRKIDLADEIFVINVGGYIGESTRNEIEYAMKHHKKVSYLNAIN